MSKGKNAKQDMKMQRLTGERVPNFYDPDVQKKYAGAPVEGESLMDRYARRQITLANPLQKKLWSNPQMIQQYAPESSVFKLKPVSIKSAFAPKPGESVVPGPTTKTSTGAAGAESLLAGQTNVLGL